MEDYIRYFFNDPEKLIRLADEKCREVHGDKVYLRGLIEFSNFCSMNCQYCGIRSANSAVKRYRLTADEIINAVSKGYSKGLKTFVLQSGEDDYYSDDILEKIIITIKETTEFEAAITLSIGIRSRESYRRLKNAGADRFLMRFETSDAELYRKLKNGQSLEKRLSAIRTIKDLGYEAGSGFMTGLPGETIETIVDNVLLCKELELDMIGIGPFIPHPETPLGNMLSDNTNNIENNNNNYSAIDIACRAVALTRLMLPLAHIPATTAAGSIDKTGREKMLQAGANVLMPNITPLEYKGDYLLYPGKICIDEDFDCCLNCLTARIVSCNKTIDFSVAGAVR